MNHSTKLDVIARGLIAMGVGIDSSWLENGLTEWDLTLIGGKITRPDGKPVTGAYVDLRAKWQALAPTLMKFLSSEGFDVYDDDLDYEGFILPLGDDDLAVVVMMRADGGFTVDVVEVCGGAMLSSSIARDELTAISCARQVLRDGLPE